MYVQPVTQFVRLRRRVAGWFGRREHFSGELLGGVLLGESLIYPSWRSFIPFGIWIIYFISHRLEKRIYGKLGWR